jgi:hypothetical protein
MESIEGAGTTVRVLLPAPAPAEPAAADGPDGVPVQA